METLNADSSDVMDTPQFLIQFPTNNDSKFPGSDNNQAVGTLLYQSNE